MHFPTIGPLSQGVVYVVQPNNQVISRVGLDGVYRIFTGVYAWDTPGFAGDGTLVNQGLALYNYPTGIAIDRFDNLLIADTGELPRSQCPPANSFANIILLALEYCQFS